MTNQLYHKHSHCSYCGHPFTIEQAWPRHCSQCANVSFQNPLPVAVLLLPVDAGVLVIRRGIEPRRGQLALPGGYIEVGESWQAAAARELYEEAGVTIDLATVREFRVRSAPDGTVLIFGQGPTLRTADLPPFIPTPEASERIVLTELQELAFPLHTQVVKEFLGKNE